MDDREINALAKGMAPFVRDVVDEAASPIIARLAELEAWRMLPPQLAVEVAAAVRLLHEAPALLERTVTSAPPLPRVTRIERDDDGNFVPVYGEPPP